jgi:hypothetical protein
MGADLGVGELRAGTGRHEGREANDQGELSHALEKAARDAG